MDSVFGKNTFVNCLVSVDSNLFLNKKLSERPNECVHFFNNYKRVSLKLMNVKWTSSCYTLNMNMNEFNFMWTSKYSDMVTVLESKCSWINIVGIKFSMHLV